MRQNPALVFLIALLVIAALVAGGLMWFNSQSSGTLPQDQLVTPTDIPAPPIDVLESAVDVPANQLIAQRDFERFFTIRSVDPSEVAPDDILASEFATLVAGRVTVTDIAGGQRIKRSLLRDAGIIEQIPTPEPGQGARKAMTVYITDLGDIARVGNTVDIVASYNLETKYLRFVGVDQDGVIQLIDDGYLDVSTKVIAQDVPVLKVDPPIIIPVEGQPVAEPTAIPEEPVTDDGSGTTFTPPATPVPVFNQGTVWSVVLAVTDQEAELIDYTRAKIGTLSLIVRRADDREQVPTSGVTMDLLNRLYFVPQPYAPANMLVDLVKAPAPPQPPRQPPVVIPVPPPFGPGAPVALPTAETPAEPTPSP